MTTSHPNRPSRVVVGVDGSDESKLALRWAAYFALSAGAVIEAVTAWQYPIAFGWGAAPIAWSPGQDMEKVLTETVDEVFGTHRPEDMRLDVREGNAAKVLLDASADALMLVVGSR